MTRFYFYDDTFTDWPALVDWHSTTNPRVAAKLRRFNDLPEVCLNRHLETLALRQLIRNAYELFFSGVSSDDVPRLLWDGVRWELQAETAGAS